MNRKTKYIIAFIPILLLALAQFFREIRWLEDQVQRRIVCQEKLEKWEPELAYLGISVTQIYNCGP